MASQQRQQPFFKTSTSLTTTSGSYFLNYNTSSNKNGNQGNLSQQSTAVSRANSSFGTNFFAPNSTVSRQKDKELERETTQTTERLSALHNKLHQEAEKIRKWKTKTDLELNEKTKKLQDAGQTIEGQRKSILELQFQNEKLSSKLQEEIAGQVELEHKTIATRELCKVLKDQVCRIDEAVAAGEQDRDELHYSGKQHLEQFQELVVKFQELEIQHSTKYNEMKDKLQKQHEKQSACIAETTQNIQEKDKQIKILTEEKAEKDFKISALVKDLGENREHLETTKNEEVTLKDKLRKTESIITSQDINLKSVNEMLAYSQDENKKLISQVYEKDHTVAQIQDEKLKLEQTLKDRENQYIIKAEIFQANIMQLTNEIDAHKTRINELRNKMEMLTSELECKKKEIDELKVEIEKLLKDSDEMKESNEKLTCYQEDLIKCLRELEAEKDSLQKKNSTFAEKETEFKAAQESSKRYTTELEQEKESLEKEIERNLQCLLEKGSLIEELQMKIKEKAKKEIATEKKMEKLETLLKEGSLNHESITNDLDDIKAEKQELKKQLDEASKEIRDMNEQMKGLKKCEANLKKDLEKSTQEREKLEAEVSQLKNEQQEKQDELDQTLDMEINTTKTLRQQLSGKEKELSSLEHKIKTMQNQLTSKTKQFKDLQQEMRTMKTSSTTQTKKIKALEKKIETLETEVVEKSSESHHLQEKSESLQNEMEKRKEENAKELEELKRLQADLDKSVTHGLSLEEEHKKLKEIAEQALKEKERARCQFDKDRAELCATLENYKAENELIVAQKEKDLEKFKQSTEIQTEKQMKRIKDLERQLNDLNRCKLETEKAQNEEIMTKCAEINVLKKQLLDKEQEASEDIEMQRVAETPSRGYTVPSTIKTPRSALKQSGQASKKRRVAFSTQQSKSCSSDEDSQAIKVFKPNEKKTIPRKGTSPDIPTKVVRPNVRRSPTNAVALSKKSTPSTMNKLKTKKNSSEEESQDEEKKMFKELFPDACLEPQVEKETPRKGKKSSFRSKITKISPKKSTLDVDWFDNDAFFGFKG